MNVRGELVEGKIATGAHVKGLGFLHGKRIPHRYRSRRLLS